MNNSNILNERTKTKITTQKRMLEDTQLLFHHFLNVASLFFM